jgi:hypothetical protein
MRKVGYVARMGRAKIYTGFWWGNLSEKCYLEDLGIYGMIVLQLDFKG